MALHGTDGLVEGAGWVAGIAVLVLLVRLVAGTAGGFSPRSDETPEQILKRRGSVVSIARPGAMFEIVKSGALQAVVQEADQRLRLALDQVKGK